MQRAELQAPCSKGDMLLSREQQHQILAGFEGRRSKRQAYNDKTYPGRRWYEGVNYTFDMNISNKTRSLFKTAAGLWMNNTCINFYQDENETSVDLLVVIKEYGCWSEVGRQGDWQFMSLDGGCETVLDQKSFNLKPRNF
ncbi:astacin [Ostertagia ostertagi]